MKEDDEDEEEAIGSVPRLPNTFCEFLSFLNVFYLVIEDTYLFV
jgi:hypothetical protein